MRRYAFQSQIQNRKSKIAEELTAEILRPSALLARRGGLAAGK